MTLILNYGKQLIGNNAAGSNSFTNPITSLNTTTTYVAGFLDGSTRARLFDASVALPLPTVVPVQLTDPQGNSTGGYYLQLTYASGSLDAGSPAQFLLDQYAIVLVAATATQ